jgi:hypothetical protein
MVGSGGAAPNLTSNVCVDKVGHDGRQCQALMESCAVNADGCLVVVSC